MTDNNYYDKCYECKQSFITNELLLKNDKYHCIDCYYLRCEICNIKFGVVHREEDTNLCIGCYEKDTQIVYQKFEFESI